MQEDALGSRAVLPVMLGQQNLVRDLLTECSVDLRPRLLSTYSNMSTSIGYYFFELNDAENAKHYYEQARLGAHDAGGAELGIYALGEWSYAASWEGKAPVALDLACAARNLLDRTDDPLMRVCVAQRTATAYAFDGRYRECMVELDRARDGLASRQVADGSPWYFYDAGYLASHESECLLRLGRSQEAAASARSGLALYDTSFVDGHAVCTLHLGNARLQTKEIDEASRVVGDAARLVAQTRSARLMAQIRTTRDRMQPWQDTRSVKTLDDQLASMGFLTSSEI